MSPRPSSKSFTVINVVSLCVTLGKSRGRKQLCIVSLWRFHYHTLQFVAKLPLSKHDLLPVAVFRVAIVKHRKSVRNACPMHNSAVATHKTPICTALPSTVSHSLSILFAGYLRFW